MVILSFIPIRTSGKISVGFMLKLLFGWFYYGVQNIDRKIYFSEWQGNLTHTAVFIIEVKPYR